MEEASRPVTLDVSRMQWAAEASKCSAEVLRDSDCSGVAPGNEPYSARPLEGLPCSGMDSEECTCGASSPENCKRDCAAYRLWHWRSPEAQGARRERSNSDSSTCAADRLSSAPPSPSSAQLSSSVFLSARQVVEGCSQIDVPPHVLEERLGGAPSGSPPASFSHDCPQRDVSFSKPCFARGGSGRGFLDYFYSRQREQKIKEMKSRNEAQQSLATWRRVPPNSSSTNISNSGSSSVLSRFLRSSSLTKQRLLGPLFRAASMGGQQVCDVGQQLQEDQLEQQEQELQRQQNLLRQLQLRAGERPLGALVAARSQMLQREQQQDAKARRSCVPSSLAASSPPLLRQQQQKQLCTQFGIVREERRRRMRSLPSRLTVWTAGRPATPHIAMEGAAVGTLAATGGDRNSKMNSTWREEGPVARELGGVAAEAVAKAAAQSVAAKVAAAAFRESVELFQSLRRTASDAQLCTRQRGPCWAGQRQLTRAGVGELLDMALEVGAATAAAAPPQEAAAVARSVEGLVAALQVRVAQGQQRVKLYFLTHQAARNNTKNCFTEDPRFRRRATVGVPKDCNTAAPHSGVCTPLDRQNLGAP